LKLSKKDVLHVQGDVLKGEAHVKRRAGCEGEEVTRRKDLAGRSVCEVRELGDNGPDERPPLPETKVSGDKRHEELTGAKSGSLIDEGES